MLALTVDFFAIATVAQILNWLVSLAGLISMDFARAAMVALYFAISILYGILLEFAWDGQTLGKRLFRLRVIDRHGLRLSFAQVALRNFLRFADMLPMFYLGGGAASLLSPRFQRLGDLVADTVVIRQPHPFSPDLSAVEFPKFNSLKAHPHLAARLRQRIGPAAAALMAEAVLRRDEFAPEARVELFAELAAFGKSLVAFPPEALESSADEQIVRNILEVVYEKARRE